MPLPDFIIVGAMKSGTSTLHSNLQLHPKIGMSRLKEPHYFDKFYSRPIEWYSNQFNSNKEINGESTPAYTWYHYHPEVPKRIFETIPNAKLIYVLRDPIDRIISHLHHDLYRGRLKLKDIDKVVLKDPQYLLTSKYYFQISKYFENFSEDKILLIQTSYLKDDLNGALNSVCDFLKVPNFKFTDKVRVRNQSSRKYLIMKYDLAHKYLPRKLSKLYHLIFYMINIKIDRPVLADATLQELQRRLQSDVLELKEYSGMDFKSWKTYNSINVRLKNSISI